MPRYRIDGTKVIFEAQNEEEANGIVADLLDAREQAVQRWADEHAISEEARIALITSDPDMGFEMLGKDGTPLRTALHDDGSWETFTGFDPANLPPELRSSYDAWVESSQQTKGA